MNIGGDRQLFLDGELIERLESADLHFHDPVPREVCLRFGRPWKGSVSWCPVVLKDGDRYRIWYRSQEGDESLARGHSSTAYAESEDGEWSGSGRLWAPWSSRDQPTTISSSTVRT